MENNCTCTTNTFNKVSQIPLIEVISYIKPDHIARFVDKDIHIQTCLINKCTKDKKGEDFPFRVSTNKNIFYCFACEVGGDAITLVSKVKKLTQIEAATNIINLKYYHENI